MVRALALPTLALVALTFTVAQAVRGQAESAPADAPADAPDAEAPAGGEAPDDDDDLGEDDMAPEGVSEEVFEAGVRAYRDISTATAAEKLWDYLKGNDQTADHYEWAEYYLAKSFIRLGLRHAAVEYFYNVAKEQKRPELLPDTLRELEQIMTFYPYDEEMIIVDLLGSQEFENLPPDVKSFVEYHQGQRDLLQNRIKWARRHLGRLERTKSTSRLAKRYVQRAGFTRSITTLKRTHSKESKAMRDEREEALKQLEAIVEADFDDYELKNESRKTIARLHFEEGRYEEALKWYDTIEVPFLSREEASLFVEKAWARYYLGDFRGTLGILLSLEAPSYRRYYNPERYILKSFAYNGLCHYAAAKGAAREFLRRYGANLEQLKKSRQPLSDPLIRRAAAQKRKPSRMLKLLRALQRERSRIDKVSNGNGLVDHLGRIYDLKIAEVNRKLDALVKDAGEEVAEDLLDYEEQAGLLDYEISLEVFRRLKSGTGKRIAVDEDPPVPLSSDDIYYQFDGEYWNDELHNYRFRIDNRCFGERLFE